MNSNFPSLYEIAIASADPTRRGGRLTDEQRQTQRELNEIAGSKFGSANGTIFPWYAEQRAGSPMSATGQTSIAGDQGGNTIPTAIPEIGSAFRDALVVEKLGARVLGGLVGNIDLPSTQPGLALAWSSENATSPQAQELFQQLALSPYRVTAYFDLSVELVRAAGPAIEAFLRAELMSAAAVAVQQVAVAGTGTNQPLGILNTVGIGSVAGGANGAAPSYQNLCDLEYAVTGTGKADRGNVGWLLSPYVRRKLRTTQMFSGSPGPIWANTEAYALLGRSAGVTTASPDNLTKGSSSGVCSAIACGEFSELFIGLWGPGPIIEAVTSASYAATGQVRLVATVYASSGVRIPTAFAAMTDALCA